MTTVRGRRPRAALLVPLLVPLLACGEAAGDPSAPVLTLAGIPDQDPSRLREQFEATAAYLSRAAGLAVRYVPANDYAAVVSAFQRGDVQLAWLGGLTGVQALEVTAGTALAQRPRDAEFHSVFIVGPGVAARTLADLEGLTFTFGSESSTSGHLMPRHFLVEAGVDPDTDFAGDPGYSGSHDRTWALVEAGAYQAGALNEAVWEAALAGGAVDTGKVRVLLVTPPYFDYHWAIRDDVDATHGAGTRARILAALLRMGDSDDPDAVRALELFQADRFVPTASENYAAIRAVAEGLGILR